jgi:hypothetical protein
MKYILALLIFSTLSFGQIKMYEYKTFDMRTPDGWNMINIPGEVHIDNSCNEIIIINKNVYMVFNWTTRQQFIRNSSYLYITRDWRDVEVTIKIDNEPETNRDTNIELYYYSDEPGMKYFRLRLTLCKN